jgi:DtxR family transcriptional regulator, Mn-dependent transcriptional regulator
VSSEQLSESMEMYLKAMLEMSDREPATVGRLAERLSVTPVSANEMVRRLHEHGLVKHTPYKGAALTEKGREVACNVMRRQRLWEVFLFDHLKIEWSKIYELACSLEHATAPEVTDALSAFLGDPKTCPRGNPIPAADGSFSPLDGIPLSEATVGEGLRVVAVNATSTDVLKYLQDRGILPGSEITISEIAPLQGPLTLKVGKREVALGLSMADFIIVKGK